MILVTGANGFLGGTLLTAMKQKGLSARGSVRNSEENQNLSVGDIGPNTDWKTALQDVDVVVHTAAKVSAGPNSLQSLNEFRKVNVDGTLHLARQAMLAGVKRFVFISSIKVHGESTARGMPFRETDRLDPRDSYAISKQEAEAGLRKMVLAHDMDIVVIRPPLVYGPGVSGNFRSIMSWISRGLPLPIGSIDNRRSLVFVDNLVDLLITCIEHPAASNQTFIAGDGEDLSTVSLSRELGEHLGQPVRLFPVPTFMLRFVAVLLGKTDAAQRICENLQVDISVARELLAWEPPYSVSEGLRLTVEDYQRKKGRI